MNRIKFYMPLIILVLQFLIITSFTLAAGQDSIPQLSSADKKKIEEANSLKKNTDKTMVEVNKLEEEILKSNVSDNDKSGQKKLKKSQASALRKHIDALDNYGSVHDTYFNVYGSYITKFWNHFSGDKSSLSEGKKLEEQAHADFSKAKKLRKETEGYEYGTLVLDKLMEADSLEKSALISQNTALKIYTIWPQKYIPVSHPDTNANIAKADTGQKAVTDMPAAPAEPVPAVTNLSEKAENDSTVSPAEIPAKNIVNKEDQQASPQDTAKTVQLPEPVPEPTPAKEVAPVAQQAPTVPSNIAEDNSTEKEKQKSTLPESDNNLIINENDFEKFLKFLNEIPSSLQGKKVSNFEAFQQAWENYLTDNTVKPDNKKPQIKKSVSVNNNFSTSGLVFRLQIAASHQPLVVEKMKRIAKGNPNYNIISETNWNKCFLGSFKSYEEANNYKKNAGISGAFVVAFYKGRQIEIAQALKLSK
ncbi:MAG: SPOR domain-containing protein [Bacteroidota bacterium]|nr:SPOR domain-containing protein [Bacteroidota bacterium]